MASWAASHSRRCTTIGTEAGSSGWLISSWSLLALIWTCAVAGVVFKLLAGARYRKVSVALYVAMGWAALAVIQPLWTHMEPRGLAWLFAGGIAYTGGVAFYLMHERMRYSHFAWHLCVLGGTACHFVMVLRYA